MCQFVQSCWSDSVQNVQLKPFAKEGQIVSARWLHSLRKCGPAEGATCTWGSSWRELDKTAGTYVCLVAWIGHLTKSQLLSGIPKLLTQPTSGSSHTLEMAKLFMGTSSPWFCWTFHRSDVLGINWHQLQMVGRSSNVHDYHISYHSTFESNFYPVGLLERVVLDNGPTFISKDFKNSHTKMHWVCNVCIVLSSHYLVGGKSNMNFQRKAEEVEEWWHADETSKFPVSYCKAPHKLQ